MTTIKIIIIAIITITTMIMIINVSIKILKTQPHTFFVILVFLSNKNFHYTSLYQKQELSFIQSTFIQFQFKIAIFGLSQMKKRTTTQNIFFHTKSFAKN